MNAMLWFMCASLFIFFHYALAIDTETSTAEVIITTSESEIQPDFNDTYAELLTPLDNSSSIVLKSTDNNVTDSNVDVIPTESYFVICDPDHTFSTCRKHLLETCRPISGAHRCACPENVSRDEDGKCTVINECLDKNYHNCSIYATCTDLPKGYNCTCKSGYRDAAEVENMLPGRVCMSLHWVIGGRKDGSITFHSINNQDINDEIQFGSPIADSANATWIDDSNRTEIEISETLDDAPLNSNVDLNISNPSFRLISNASKISFASLTHRPTQVRPTTPKIVFPKANDKLSIHPKFIDKKFVHTTLIEKITTPEIQTTTAPKIDDNETTNPQFLESITSTPLSLGSLKEVFDTFDTDGNDLISYYELKKAIEIYHIGLKDGEIRDMIIVADLSGEGLVDFREFSTLMRKGF